MSSINLHTENIATLSPSTIESEGSLGIDGSNLRVQGQLTQSPILPFLDRPSPILEAIEEYTPIIPRAKLLGVFGIAKGFRGQYTRKGKHADRIIPYPYPWKDFQWGKDRPIANLPSVEASSIVTGPMRTISPQMRDVTRKIESARIFVEV